MNKKLLVLGVLALAACGPGQTLTEPISENAEVAASSELVNTSETTVGLSDGVVEGETPQAAATTTTALAQTEAPTTTTTVTTSTTTAPSASTTTAPSASTTTEAIGETEIPEDIADDLEQILQELEAIFGELDAGVADMESAFNQGENE